MMEAQPTILKSAAIGNRAELERPTQMVPFHRSGPVLNTGRTDLGYLKLAGGNAVCLGYRLEMQVPAQVQWGELEVTIRSGDGQVVPGSASRLSGIQPTGELRMSEPLVMPETSFWFASIDFPDGLEPEYRPAGITFTYLLSPYKGRLPKTGWVPFSMISGVGVDLVGDTFIVA